MAILMQDLPIPLGSAQSTNSKVASCTDTLTARRRHTPDTAKLRSMQHTRPTASEPSSSGTIWKRRASVKQLGAALVAGGGALTGILTATNASLHGVAFLLALTLGTVGVLVIVEAANRDATPHRFFLSIAGGGLLVLGLAVGLWPPHRPHVSLNPLRTAWSQTAPTLFDVGFHRDIGLPDPSIGWAALHARGGIDIYESAFRFTFANRSSAPLSITDVHAQVLGAVSPPSASEAGIYAQGDQPFKSFVANLDNRARGSMAALHRVNPDQHSYDHAPFFQANVISLQPGELYQGTVTVTTSVGTDLRYRFVVSGQTASGSFVTIIPDVFEIAGGPVGWNSYYHHYRNLDECELAGGHAWIKVSTYAQWQSDPYDHGCPHGSRPGPSTI